MSIKDGHPPFLLDTIYNLTMVTHIGRVLNNPWNKPPLPKCSSVDYKSSTLYTLWLSTKGLCKAYQLPKWDLGHGCNWYNRAAGVFDRFNFWNGSNSE